MIFKWLKDPRFSPNLEGTAEGLDDGSLFLPVEIAGPTIGSRPEMAGPAAPTAALAAQRVDITLSDGRRFLVEGPTALSAVMGMVQGLMA